MTEQRRLLAAVAAELARAADDVAAIGAGLAPLAERSVSALRAAQDTDRLEQTLTALSQVLTAVSEGVEPGEVLPAVTLADLASRLAGLRSDPPPGGELDLF